MALGWQDLRIDYPIPLCTLSAEEGGSWFFGRFIQQNISIPFLITSLQR